MRVFDWLGSPDYTDYIPGRKFPEGGSIMPFFPGYEYDHGKSTYRGEVVGEGGYVYTEPGMYGNVAVLDIASMHPNSIRAEQLFGEEYTRAFCDLLDARVAIKHRDFDTARKMLGGKLAPYLDDESKADDLANALKIAINSVYGLTSASFNNPFRDNRNKDNIVAKRGALFMVNLRDEVRARGFMVAHIKTDSIKIPDATMEIIRFVTEYGREFGYSFEHEATYDKMCLVNKAVFVAKYASVDHCIQLYGQDYINSSNDILKLNKRKAGQWSATGTQFAVPYVFKKLFSKEPIEFKDLCETKAVTTALYLRFDEPEPEFVGRVGQFCPMVEVGGELLREGKDKDGNQKFDAAAGSKGYLWMESEMVKNLGHEDKIDRRYYDKQVDEAAAEIAKYGDFEWFVSDDPYIPAQYPEEAPPWETSA